MKPERHCYKAQTGRTYLVKELFPNTQFARGSQARSYARPGKE